MRFVLSYDGSAYRGSQYQINAPSVQYAFEDGLRQLRAFGSRCVFAGRTDAGVHAAGQVVSADVRWHDELDRLRHGLNGVLPGNIRVVDCLDADPRFNARFDAIAREYRYRIVTTRVVHPLLMPFVWSRDDSLDDTLAQSASRMFIGSHDFGSFASAGKSRELSSSELTRTISVSEWSSTVDSVFPIPSPGRLCEYRVISRGFLPQMVRNLVASIVEVASGRKPLEWIEYLLVSSDRRLLGPPAPARGLVLWKVHYPTTPETGVGTES